MGLRFHNHRAKEILGVVGSSLFGFNLSAVQWFRSYLIGRTQSISVNKWHYISLIFPRLIILMGTHQRVNAGHRFSVAADNTSLERVDTFKYLGVTMDETLSWKEHVS